MGFLSKAALPFFKSHEAAAISCRFFFCSVYVKGACGRDDGDISQFIQSFTIVSSQLLHRIGTGNQAAPTADGVPPGGSIGGLCMAFAAGENQREGGRLSRWLGGLKERLPKRKGGGKKKWSKKRLRCPR